MSCWLFGIQDRNVTRLASVLKIGKDLADLAADCVRDLWNCCSIEEAIAALLWQFTTTIGDARAVY
jgi:hypothetical protein